MNSRRSRTFALALGAGILAVGGFGAWQIFRARTAPPTIQLVDRGNPQRAVFLRRAAERESGASAASVSAWPLRMPAEDAGLLWPLGLGQFQYDPDCYYRYRGGLDLPLGSFHLRTSQDGFREDFERLATNLDEIVLVTGDSHTDGLCDNSASFANVSEKRLCAATGRRIEVLNAGVTGYGFYNYVGVLERFANLAPRVFVVAFYQGNDFVDSIYAAHYAHRTIPPPANREMWKMLEKVSNRDQAVMGNALNQTVWLHTNPDQEEFVRSVLLEIVDRIHSRCRELGVKAVFVHIPSCLTVDERFRPAAERARAEIGLTDADFARIERFSDDVLARVRANGDDALDMRAQLLADTGANYWGDMHISITGHRVVADALTPLLERIRSANPTTKKP